MKKLILSLCCFMFFTNIYGLGIGVEGGTSINILSSGKVDFSIQGDAALTIKLSQNNPLSFGLNSTNGFKNFNLFADCNFVNFPINNLFNFYTGLGAYGGIGLSPFYFEAGGRLPLGINGYFFDNFLETYFQITPSVGFNFSETSGLSTFVPITIGIRIWLDHFPDFGNLDTPSVSKNKNKANINLNGLHSLQSELLQASFEQVFSTVFYIGGIYPDYTKMNSGEGLKWKHKYTDNSEKYELTTEFALLKKLENEDSWWYICMINEEGKMEYECLFDSQMNVKKIRYEENNNIEEYIFPIPSSPQKSSSSYINLMNTTSLGLNFNMDLILEYNQGSEDIKIPAGSYNVTKCIYEYGSSKELTSFKWYLSKDIPGELIKYNHKYGDNVLQEGELQSFKDDYKTKFNSF